MIRIDIPEDPSKLVYQTKGGLARDARGYLHGDLIVEISAPTPAIISVAAFSTPEELEKRLKVTKFLGMVLTSLGKAVLKNEEK